EATRDGVWEFKNFLNMPLWARGAGDRCGRACFDQDVRLEQPLPVRLGPGVNFAAGEQGLGRVEACPEDREGLGHWVTPQSRRQRSPIARWASGRLFRSHEFGQLTLKLTLRARVLPANTSWKDICFTRRR